MPASPAEATAADPPVTAAPPAFSRRAVRRAFAGMMLANLLLSFGPWLVRLADVGPVAAGAWRLAIAAPLLVLLARRVGQPLGAIPRTLWPLAIVAGLAFAADLALWHVGIHHTRLANATLFGNAASVFFVLYGFLVARRLPSGLQGVALLLAFAGMVLLVGRSYELSRQNVLGDVLCVAAGLFYTVYLVAMDRARGRIAPIPAVAAATVIGIAPLFAAALLIGEAVIPRDVTPLILLAIGSQVLGQGLIVHAIARLSPLVVGLAFLTQPVVAATIGWLAYGERLAPADLIGAAAIACALVLVRLRPEPTT